MIEPIFLHKDACPVCGEAMGVWDTTKNNETYWETHCWKCGHAHSVHRVKEEALENFLMFEPIDETHVYPHWFLAPLIVAYKVFKLRHCGGDIKREPTWFVEHMSHTVYTPAIVELAWRKATASSDRPWWAKRA